MLWCQLHSLLPVLRLLPSLTMVAAQVTMERRYGAIPRDIYHLPKRMALDEWDRLTGYAAYVRKLYVVQPPHLRPKDITAESWTLIVQAFGNRPLLPNLRTLEWNTDQRDTEFAGLTAFLAPTLENLTVFCNAHSPWESTLLEPAWRSRVDQFIPEIPRRVPRLVNFSFHCGALHPDCVVGPLSLNHPHSLRALTLAADYRAGPLSHFSITAMARFTTVEYLNFRLAVADIPLADLLPKLELDKLDHLFLSPTGGPGANLAYGLFASVNLRILDLNNVQYTGAAALRRMVTAHARSFPRLGVYKCWLSYQHVQSLPEPHASLSELFRPLLGLRAVDLSFEAPVPTLWRTCLYVCYVLCT
ncbi:hypothetical protein BN946_scf184585.g13 [Trametes cinnabarina]|uniref:Uncharacterized protein n=1 Tax=Pycnoporus cinnabarinus TaxID=5643 RepID=A0A060SMS8_PYCCI|nr:hypothetical protein BN946_scf184585.g13 [Trametes cinnabarina]